MSIDEKVEDMPGTMNPNIPDKVKELLLYEQQKYQGNDRPYEMSSGPSYVDISPPSD